MAEIDTAAPFASVRDAVYMFDEHSENKIQRAFSTTNALQSEKIHSLQVELHQFQKDLTNSQNQLQIAESAAANASKELAKTKNLLEENNRERDKMMASEISLLESQLDATLQQETQRSQEMERHREEIKKLSHELKDLKVQHRSTLDALTKSCKENDTLRDDLVRETQALAYEHEHNLKERDDLAEGRRRVLHDNLLATKDMLSKADAAREKVEEEFQVHKEMNRERVNAEIYNSTVVIEKLKAELEDAEVKQEEIILAVEKLKNELLTTKEAEKRALQAGADASLTLKRMRIEVEDSKVAKEKARMMVNQLEDMNVKLTNATEEEQNLLASLASLQAELNNANHEIQTMKKEAEDTSIEMEEHVNLLQLDLDAAINQEAKTKKSLSDLNEALQQVTAEAVEAKAAATQAAEEVVIKTQELEETLLHNRTLECRLQAAAKEMEAARASEVFAHTEMKFLKKRVKNNTDVNRNGDEVTVSYDEYETMAKKVIDSEDLAKKRVAAATAQADASKASELEISKKLESIKNLLERSQLAMKQAVQVAEAAEAAKSAIEGELRKWRSENEQRRKAAVAAVMAVGSNEVGKNNCSTGIAEKSVCKKSMAMNESPRGTFNGSPLALQPRESLAQILQYNFPKDEKIKKILFSTKISSYFGKKVK